jgi:sulfhydrogenase subunit beta (sulfur reductase)
MSVHTAVTTVIDRAGFDALIAALRFSGHTVIGPRIAEGAIGYAEIGSSDDLPAGWTDEQEAGTYRLRRRDDEALFGYAVGPQSWKRFQLPPELRLWRARREVDGTLSDIEETPAAPARYAFVGVRSCELHAMGILERVRGTGADAFIVAVNCGQAARTCFCVSMSAGPKAEQGFDLALTELLDAGGHRFLVETGTPRGAEVLAEAGGAPAAPDDVTTADAIIERTTAAMGRSMPELDLRDLLYDNLEHPRWDDVAERCLACGNCTMVCPTCFCFSVEEVTDLAGTGADRQRSWDSCFTLDHSYLHGGPVRNSNRSRYRQWMTHKLATWHDQFGTSGCVGCGRCITWCPVGIDITEEVAAIAGDT